jgi:hypothetical protein
MTKPPDTQTIILPPSPAFPFGATVTTDAPRTPPPRYAVALLRCAAVEWIAATLTSERLMWRISSPGRGEWGTLYATRAHAEAVAEAVRGELAWGEKHWSKPRPAWAVEVREIADPWPQDWPDGRHPSEEV